MIYFVICKDDIHLLMIKIECEHPLQFYMLDFSKVRKIFSSAIISFISYKGPISLEFYPFNEADKLF